MTNSEKYLKDGADVEEFLNAIPRGEITAWINNCGTCISMEGLKEWLNTQIKPTLTEDEKVILRNIPKDYVKIRRAKWIIDEKRMNYGQLEIVDDKGKYWTLCILSHLFQFIQPRRRI